MASLLLHDSTRWAEFQALSNSQPTTGCQNSRVNVLEIDVSKSPASFAGPYAFSEDVERLSSRAHSDIRIIFAALDYPTPENSRLLSILFELYGVPSAFLSERIQAVTNASNFEGSRDGAFSCWVHYLCKAIVHRPDAPTWHRAGFFLSRTAHNGLSLVCFGARRQLIEKLQGLELAAWIDIYQDPLNLMAVVMSDLQLIIDEQVWALNTAVGNHEHHTIRTTRTKDKFADDFFQDLHWVAKNAVHLKESADAAAHTCQHLLAMARIPSTPGASSETSSSVTTLTYLSTLLHSTCLRTSSLHGRVQNAIGLAFNLVAQTDSRNIMAESSSMHTMALATLIFLPISTVASIFGSQFFQFRSTEPGEATDPAATDLILSREFWLFWAVAGPLTVVVMTSWIVSHPHSIGRWLKALGCRRRKPTRTMDDEWPETSFDLAASSMLLQPVQTHSSRPGLTGSSTGSSTLVPGRYVTN